MPKVLIIDYDIDLGEFVSQAIEDMGLECSVTTSAKEFLDSASPDTTLIILDLLMPNVDGVELLRMLAKRRCAAGIILMSGIGARVIETAVELAATLGLNIVGSLQKPFRLAELQEVVRKHLVPAAAVASNSHPAIAVSEEDLRGAIERDEFVLHFQPQVDMVSQAVTGMEALVRWQHPSLGLVSPDSFIPRAEELRLIHALTWCVIRRGISMLQRFATEELPAPVLSINISTQSLQSLTFPDELLMLLSCYNIQPSQIMLEITETGLLDKLASSLDVLTRLRLKGILLSIDDFGTGYAMMQQLKRIPATELKIDRSFVSQMLESYGDRIMVQKTIEMGHELGMNVVAEGVETVEQLEFLRANYCDVAQGYLISRPLPEDDVTRWLHQYRPA
jgi:EAL domain-containing protein (putative c-di-GMP-specific phosphodiesterase class I)/CheY-like chemotaxis protein